MLKVLAFAFIALTFAGSLTESRADDTGEENEWLRYERKEQGLSSGSRSREYASKKHPKPTAKSEVQPQSVSSPSTPLYILQQTKEEPRPQEIFVTGTTSSTMPTSPFNLSGISAFSYNRPWLGQLPLSGLGYMPAPMYAAGAMPFTGSFGNPYGGAMPFAGGFANSYGGAMPFIGGFANPYGGAYSGLYSPGRAALMFGPSFNPYSLNRRTTTTTRVFQSAPSPSSGNYYQPSTTSAGSSGGYYASSGSAMIPVTPSEPVSKDYWGPAGNPFGN